MAKREIEIKRNITISLFWGVVALGLIVSNSVHDFWMVVCWIWFGYHLLSVYKNIRLYGKESRESQERYRKAQEDFKKSQQDRYNQIFGKNKKTLDELYEEYKKILEEQYRQQQKHTIKPEMSITDAYRLMKLTYSDSPDDIKKRYRQLAMQWHPDKFATESKSKQEAANRNFQKLNCAYNVIKKHKNIA